MEVKRLFTRIQSEELSLLYELVHLLENVTKYFRLHQLGMTELKQVENAEPYKVASNFVNVHKHGSRGRNKSSAKIDYYTPICIQEGEKPKPSDKLVDIHSLINYEGSLFNSVELIKQLILMWEEFLRNRTSIEVGPFASCIRVVLAQHPHSYSAKIPDGLVDDAKKKADERKFTDID